MRPVQPLTRDETIALARQILAELDKINAILDEVIAKLDAESDHDCAHPLNRCEHPSHYRG